jgi:hypothetical protein
MSVFDLRILSKYGAALALGVLMTGGGAPTIADE